MTDAAGTTVITEGQQGNAGTQQGSQGVQLPQLPANWYEGLPDDLKGEESLKLFHDVPSLAKSLVHAQKQFGVDKIPVPTKYSTPEDWQKIYQKLGLPQDLKQYQVDVPKDLGFEGERLEQFKAAAHKAGILPNQLKGIFEHIEADTKMVLDQARTKIQGEVAEAQKQLKSEWGEAYDKKLSQAKQVISLLDEPKFVEFLDKSRLGDHPQMVRIFAKLGEMMGEKAVKGSGNESGQFGNVVTPEVAKREINSIQGNYQHPYHDSRHPSHAQAVQDMQRLYQQAFPGGDA